MLMKLLGDTDADHIAVIFDAARESFRNEIYADYKAHRPDPPPELIPQFALIREATQAFNMPAIEMRGFEADDLIATYARQAVEGGAEVTIVSSDKDLMQLIRPGIRMFDPDEEQVDRPGRGGGEIRRAAGQGDRGAGPGRRFHRQCAGRAGHRRQDRGRADQDLWRSGHAAGKRAGEIKQPKRRESLQQNAELARISRELVTLKDDVAVEAPLGDFARREPDRDTLLAFLKANRVPHRDRPR